MIDRNFLICLVGLPASGKSTFAKILKSAIEKKYINLDVKIIDPDIIRQKLTSNNFEYQKEQDVRKQNLKAITNELKKGSIVISDDLNYYSSMRHELRDIAKSLEITFFIIHIATPIEICLKWNEKRGEPIPDNVIKRIQKRFDNFNRYKWDFADAVYDLSQIEDITPLAEDFVEKILTRKDKNLYRIKISEMKKKSSSNYNEKLDKITRSYVGIILKNTRYLPLKKRIIRLRKIYVKKNKNLALSESEILNSFKYYLKNKLNIQNIEDL